MKASLLIQLVVDKQKGYLVKRNPNYRKRVEGRVIIKILIIYAYFAQETL